MKTAHDAPRADTADAKGRGDSPATGPVALVRTAFTDSPGLDTAVSRALLIRADRGEVSETLRLYTPGRVLAFGKRDVITSGYGDAVTVAQRAGFQAVERLAGGRAAVFHPGTLAFSWTIPDPDPRSGIRERFVVLSTLVRDAMRRLGIDARIGEVPGEYCPGEYSVNASGLLKLMGVGQRLARNAAHVGGVIVVDGSAEVRDVLVPVYAALGIEWDPATAGSVADVLPGTSVDEVGNALLTAFREGQRLVPGVIDSATLALAGGLRREHVPAQLWPA